jgi:putative transposase
MGMIIGDMVKEMPGVEIKELNVQIDHVHVYVEIPPKYSVAGVVKQLKGGSSAKIREKVEYLAKMRTRKDVLWSRGYFVSTVGINEKIIENYVRYQGKVDSGQLRLDL